MLSRSSLLSYIDIRVPSIGLELPIKAATTGKTSTKFLFMDSPRIFVFSIRGNWTLASIHASCEVAEEFLTTNYDRIEVFGILELVLSLVDD